MYLQDALSACSLWCPPDDVDLCSLREAYAAKCLASKAYEAAGMQFLLAGNVRQAALALSRINTALAFSAACQMCLMHVESRSMEHLTNEATEWEDAEDSETGLPAPLSDLPALACSFAAKACIAAAKQGQLAWPAPQPPPQAALGAESGGYVGPDLQLLVELLQRAHLAGAHADARGAAAAAALSAAVRLVGRLPAALSSSAAAAAVLSSSGEAEAAQRNLQLAGGRLTNASDHPAIIEPPAAASGAQQHLFELLSASLSSAIGHDGEDGGVLLSASPSAGFLPGAPIDDSSAVPLQGLVSLLPGLTELVASIWDDECGWLVNLHHGSNSNDNNDGNCGEHKGDAAGGFRGKVAQLSSTSAVGALRAAADMHQALQLLTEAVARRQPVGAAQLPAGEGSPLVVAAAALLRAMCATELERCASKAAGLMAKALRPVAACATLARFLAAAAIPTGCAAVAGWPRLRKDGNSPVVRDDVPGRWDVASGIASDLTASAVPSANSLGAQFQGSGKLASAGRCLDGGGEGMGLSRLRYSLGQLLVLRPVGTSGMKWNPGILSALSHERLQLISLVASKGQ